MTLEGDEGYREDADAAWTPAIEDPDGETERTDRATETDDTPQSEWRTTAGDVLGATNADDQQSGESRTHGQSRDWSFGVIRVLRVIVGMVAFFVLLFNFDGAFVRVTTNPGLAALTIAVISQFVQIEDLQRLRSLTTR